jgi:hypothetical protein
MSDIEKARAQRDAQRTVKNRRTTGLSRAEEAMVRYLGVDLYDARRDRHEHETTEEPDTEQTTEKQ